MSDTATAAKKQLESLKDRIIRLEEEKKAIADDIKDVYAEAKANGFDTKALRIVVKRGMETPEERAARRETEVITELYLANLGMLDGTPLGDATRERMLPPDPGRNDDPDDASPPPVGTETEPDAPRGVLSESDLSDARDRGSEDCASGKRIIDNPFVAGDPRRAAWDEGHCQRSGSDGMDIPEAWRRKPKPKAESPAREGA